MSRWATGLALSLAAGLSILPAMAAEPRDRAAEARALLDAMEDEGQPRFRSWPGLFGGILAREGFTRFLAGADAAERSRLNLVIGQASEQAFDWTAAIAAYTVTAATAATPTERAAAQLGIARIQSFTAPASAEATLAGLAATPRAAAAVAQLRARMALTAGNPVMARTRLNEALVAIGRAPDADSPAMLQSIIADMSVAASFVGDIETSAAFAAASGLGSGRPMVPTYSPAAFCNPASGLLPEDAVIFDVTLYAGIPQRIVPVWSKRPGAGGAIAKLGRALATWRWFNPPAPPVLHRGIRIEVACSSAGRLPIDGSVADAPWSAWDWLDSKGIPMLPGKRQPPEARAAIYNTALIAAETRYGAKALELVPHLFRLAESGAGSNATARHHQERAVAIMASAGAPPLLLAGLRALNLDRQASEPTSAPAEIGRQLAGLIAGLSATDRDASLGLAMRFGLVQALEKAGDSLAEAATLRDLLAVPVARLPQADPLRRAVHGRLAAIEDKAGRPAEAERLRREAGLPMDLCEYADLPVQSLGVSIDGSKFPDVLRREDIGGFIRVERRVAGDGAMAGVRLVYAQPPRLFDAVSLAAFAGARNVAPMRANKPFACTANPQPVFWQLSFGGPQED